MPSTESVSHEDLILCACGEREYKTRDVIDAAAWRGDLDGAWNRLLLDVAAERHADEFELDFEDDELDAAAEAFRYERDLITAEETEQWLATRCLNLEHFGDYFARRHWGAKLGDEISGPDTSYVSAPEDLRHLFAAELMLSGDIDWLTTQLVWRLAAARAEAEPDPARISAAEEQFYERHQIDAAGLPNWLDNLGRDSVWFAEMQTIEAAYQQVCHSVLLPKAYKHEIGSLRLPLTKFETEVIELESRDAAQEALFCVTEDGMSMAEVAAEGRYPYRRVDFLLEDLPPDLQQLFTSVSAGEMVDPMPRGDGFELCRVLTKAEPDAEDPAVQARVEDRLLQRHFSALARKYVERRLGAVVTSE